MSAGCCRKERLQKSIPNDRQQALKSSDVSEAAEKVRIGQLGEYTEANTGRDFCNISVERDYEQ